MIGLLAQATEAANETTGNGTNQDVTQTITDVASNPGQLADPDFIVKAGEWFMGILPTLVLAIILLIAALIISSIVGSLVRRSLTRCKVDDTVAIFLGKLVKWLVLVAGLLTCVTVFGVDVTTFAAVLAAFGFAVGLALQGTLGSFAAGVMLLIFRPFKVGDVVKIDGELGKIAEIDLFTTAIDTFDNRRIILPNGSVFGSKIENISFHPVRRVDVSVGADYSADIDATRAALEAAIEKIKDQIKEDPAPAVVLTGLGDSSVDWAVRVWTDAPEFWDVYQALVRSVKMSLDEAGIGIPFPQMDVHLDGKIEKN